ncbi:MAG: DNA repair protein RadA [Clostridia bacterium]|nr:DNA repair protein RadA [Clostridia bacterium]
MKKNKIIFLCNECGFESAKWSGICPSCGAGNSMVEFSEKEILVKNSKISNPVKISEIKFKDEIRIKTGISELDRVLGGGIVRGSFILLSGSPGVGKSTILLQIAQNYENILYVSGEESASQLKMCCERLKIDNSSLMMVSETDINNILAHIEKIKPNLVIIDSIQTIINTELSASAGSITQVKDCASMLLNLAKSLDVPVLAVSHVNKEGAIAGPKVLEHIVDVVLYFDNENKSSYRIIRCLKNRFGSTSEIGVFEMKSNGLQEVKNPSVLMLENRALGVPGICTACISEGSRAFLTEIQALVAPTSFGMPRRVSNGYDYNRLCMLLAILEKRAGFYFANFDVYVNVVGGVKINDTSADLPVALALISSLKDIPVDSYTVAFGEIGLSGEIRISNKSDEKISEAERLGFKRFIVPDGKYEHEHKNLEKIKNIANLNYIFS